MLSPNSTLFQSRYLIARNLWSESPQPIYFARDTHTDMDVVIAEIEGGYPDFYPPGLLAHLKSLTHPAVIRMRDYFFEGDSHYLVTRPVSGTSFSQFLGSAEPGFAVTEIENGLRQLTAAMSLVGASAKACQLGLNQSNIWVTADNEFKLLYFGPPTESAGPSPGPKNDFAFQPLERIWDRLDRASQTTIANTYDDGSLDVLESPPDLRADMFSLGALFYRLLTGQMPFDALERSIEILDGNQDPLVPPNRSNPDISPELSEFIMKLMRLRREDRFETFDSAYRHLNAFVPEREQPGVFRKEQTEESDLLEIPGISSPDHSSVSNLQTQTAAREAAYFTASASPSSTTDHVYSGEVTEDPPDRDIPGDEAADDRFYATEILLPLAAREPEPADIVEEPRSRPWFLSPITAVIVVAVLIAGSVVAYLAIGAGSSEAVPSRSELKPAPIVDQPVRIESAAVPVSTQLPADTSAFQPPASQAVEPPKDTLQANPVLPTQAKARPQVADARPVGKPAGGPQDPSKPKKKVTVDDLINDN